MNVGFKIKVNDTGEMLQLIMDKYVYILKVVYLWVVDQTCTTLTTVSTVLKLFKNLFSKKWHITMSTQMFKKGHSSKFKNDRQILLKQNQKRRMITRL